MLSEPIVRILADIDAEHRALTSLMARLSVAQITARPGGEWSAIDMLNHITAWQANALQVAHLQAAADAPEIEPDQGTSRLLGLDTDQFNADLLTSHRDWTLAQALAWHNRVHADLLAALAALPPERLLGGSGPHGTRRWVALPAILHPRAHRLEFERRWQ
jgi:hypothetical protein